jgi:hypothetical protein
MKLSWSPSQCFTESFKKDRHIMQDVGFERWQLFHERTMPTRKAIAIRHE